MLDLTLLKNLLIVSIACSTITLAFIQKTKKFLPNSKLIIIYSLIVNLGFSYIFCLTFTNINWIESLWVGLFSFLGADTLYVTLEGKLASYTEIINGNSSNNNDIEGEITYE